jgi:DNA-binding beta-propeller fold protein YncE
MKAIASITCFICFVFISAFPHLEAAEVPERALVKIQAESEGIRKIGTGFIVKITPKGAYILTVSHVVEGGKPPKVAFARQKNFPVSANVTFMEGNNPKGLALLFVKKSDLPSNLLALPLATKGPLPHEELNVVGYPRSVGFLSVISGRTTRKGSDVVFLEDLGEGFSGSPMIMDGKVFGIITESMDIALAVPVNIVRTFLEGAGLPIHRPMKVAFLGKWGSEGKGNNRFGRAWGIATSWSGEKVYINDGNSGVQVFSSSGQFLSRLPGTIMGPFLAVDSNGIVYTLNYDGGTGRNKRVEVFRFKDQKLRSFLLKGPSPRAIDVDIYGKNIYIADISKNQIYKYNSNGQVIAKWGSGGSGDGQFRSPWGIAVDRYHTKRIYVADTGNNRVQVFNSNGKFINKWGSKGSGDLQFNSPIDIAVDTGSGNVYVLDRKNARVQVFSSDGEYLGKWGKHGGNNNEFIDPYGITIDSEDRVYVMDSGNHRVQVFQAVWE